MSLAFAEGLDRFAVGQYLPNGLGIGNKVIDATIINTASADVNKMYIATFLGRNWLTSYNDYRTTGNSLARVDLTLVGGLGTKDTDRTTPHLPTRGSNVTRVIYSWKASWGSQAVGSGNACYLGNFAGQQELYPTSIPTGQPGPAKGYWFCEVIFDVATKRMQFFVDGVLKFNVIITNGRDDLRLNLNGMVRLVNGSVTTNGNLYVTDIIVVYDDGIEPCRRLGDVDVRDVLMAIADPKHPDAVFASGVDSTTRIIRTIPHTASPEAVKLVGAGTNVSYKPADTQSRLGSGVISSLVVDTTRAAGSPIAGDLEVKVQTTNGSTIVKESPEAMNTNYQSVIRVPSKPMSVERIKTDLKVDVTTRAR